MRLLIIIILLTLVIVGGCRQGPSPLEIFTGTKGVTVEFHKSIPPKKVFEGEIIQLFVDIENEGAFTWDNNPTRNGVVQLDFDPLYFLETRQPNQFHIHGKSVDWPSGERISHYVSSLTVKSVPGTRENPITPITVSVCYPYETTLSTDICIDRDVLDAEAHPVCENKEVYTFSSQGAPVAVTKIESDMIPTGTDTVQPVFRITLTNVDDGLVLYNNPFSPVSTICAIDLPGTTIQDLNVLRVQAWLGSENTILKCVPENVRLWQKKGETTCTIDPNRAAQASVDMTPTGNYVSILTVKADYVYRNFDQRDVTIYRLP
jgi:hypothetical protein